ncbi:MAG: hypothetical protein P1P87_17720, partial [Trueperaceae bacterium]|nr:hypothetical protein [Trueperaceae bacterium]
MSSGRERLAAVAPAMLLAMLLGGCGALIDRATTNFANDLEQAVVNYDEPLVVERGLPAFLLILEARREASPDDADLLVNLAFSSSSRSSGTWSNSYSSSQTIYTYVNPPVQSGSKHGYVNKLLLAHKDWDQFWNNPDKMI